MPLPEKDNISASMFQGLKGEDFSETRRIVDELIEVPFSIQRPPGDKVLVVAGGGYPHSFLPIGMEQAFLLRGEAFNNFLTYVVDNDLIPHYGAPLDTSKLLSKGFDIRLSFDEQKQDLHVHQKGQKSFINLDNGPMAKDVLSQTTRVAVAALAVVPADLWGNIRKQGLITGVLGGDFYNPHWMVKSYSLMINDQDGVLTYVPNKENLLQSYDPESLRRRDHEKIFEFLKARKLIGIFSDIRTAEMNYIENPLFA